MSQSCYLPLTVLQALLHSPAISESCEWILNAPATPTPWIPWGYFPAFFLTVTLEWPIYFLVLRKLSAGARIRLMFLANLATHPVIYFLFPWIAARFAVSRSITLSVSEVFAPVVEAAILAKYGRVRWPLAFGSMAAANLASWWIGARIFG